MCNETRVGWVEGVGRLLAEVQFGTDGVQKPCIDAGLHFRQQSIGGCSVSPSQKPGLGAFALGRPLVRFAAGEELPLGDPLLLDMAAQPFGVVCVGDLLLEPLPSCL